VLVVQPLAPFVTKRRSILLVDADDGARGSLAELLRECGYGVKEARTGAEGLQLARADVPALLIVDPWPSVSAAAQLIGQVKRFERGSRVPVLILSSVARPYFRSGSPLSPPPRFLSKPIPAYELLTEIGNLLEGAASEPTAFKLPKETL
jgi:DNA-binding response OmpR family regulator